MTFTPSIGRAPTRQRFVEQGDVYEPVTLNHLYVAKIENDLFVIVAPDYRAALAVVLDRYGVYHKDDLPFDFRLVEAPMLSSGELGAPKEEIFDRVTKRQ